MYVARNCYLRNTSPREMKLKREGGKRRENIDMTEKSWENAAIEMRNAPSFHRAAAYRRSPIDSSSYRYPPADTASSYISGEIAIPLSSRSLFPSPFVRFCPGEFQKRYFMRSLFNPRPFVIARSDTAAILFVRYRATMTEARDCIRFARARARKVLL